jgi:hypothetical protein
VYYLFSHLALNHNTQVACDPTYPEFDESAFIDTEWKEIYEDIKEAVPIDVPTPLGKEVELHLYVDSVKVSLISRVVEVSTVLQNLMFY